MSRLFAVASSQYGANASAVVTTTPLSMACWFYPTDITTDGVLMSIGTNGSNDHYHYLEQSGGSAGDPVSAVTRSTATAAARSTAGYTANAWFHAAGVWTSATSRAAFCNGVAKGTSALDRNAAGMNETLVGARSGASITGFAAARIAEAAIWNVALTDDEVLSLANGISPLLIRPAALKFYAPLIGAASPEPEFVGRRDLTLTNTPTQADHPRLFRPRYRIFPIAAAVASAAVTGTATPSATEAEIVAGGETIILTLTNDTWVATGATFDAQRQNIIDGIDSAQAEANGWDAERANLAVTDVVRTSDTVVTITLPALASYAITANETLTVTIPATAVTGAGAIVASPTISLTATGSSAAAALSYYRKRRVA